MEISMRAWKFALGLLIAATSRSEAQEPDLSTIVVPDSQLPLGALESVVEGRVVDLATGEGIRGAEVSIRIPGFDSLDSVVTTDDAGGFAATNSVALMKPWFEVRA